MERRRFENFVEYIQQALPYGKIRRQGCWWFIYGTYGDRTIFRINTNKNKKGRYHMSRYDIENNKWHTYMFLYSIPFGLFMGMTYDIAREKNLRMNKETFEQFLFNFGVYEVLQCVSKIEEEGL